MNVLLLTLGSRGDVQPFVALARGLQAAGHSVTLCTNEHFAGFVRSHGLTYAHMDNGFVDLIQSVEGRAAIERMRNLPGALASVAKLLRRIGPLQRDILHDAWRAARALQPDVVVFHSKLPGAVDIADALSARAIMAPLFPQLATTSAFPAVGFPDLPLGAGYRRGTYRLVQRLSQRFGSGPIRAWRAECGLGPRPRSLGPVCDGQGRPIPLLHAFSPSIRPAPDDWPANAVVVGDWPLAAAPDWSPSQALRSFLAAGPPPVYVGFGSMAGSDPTRATALVVDALARAGCRGLLAHGWGGLGAQALPPGMFVIDEAPHDWLFARVSAVVHHGGAGTTAAGLRAGKPTVICPFFADQPFWGRRVHALGAGPAPIPQKRLTASRLAAAIVSATADADIQRAAEAIGHRMRAERGIETAVASIEHVANGNP